MIPQAWRWRKPPRAVAPRQVATCSHLTRAGERRDPRPAREDRAARRGPGPVLKVAAAVGRFPDRELEIHRLCARQLEFRAACEDFADAVAAQERWRNADGDAASRADEYRALVEELETEILAALDADRCGKPPSGG